MSIRVQKLSYTYHDRTEPALLDVTAQFSPGEVTLIAGVSGCGKTTLIRSINGLIPHSYANGRLQGAVEVFGRSVAGMTIAQISQLVGTVLQDPERQIVSAKVEDEIAFGLENQGLPRIEIVQRVRETAEMLHIGHLLRRETFRLSGGEKQKVVLAGVLAMRPQVIMLDEPLASLDPASGREALLVMRKLAASGIAIVIVEHRVEDVLTIHPEHCIYMAQGRITYDGDARGLMQSVDWREIKLPAGVVIERVRAEMRQSEVHSDKPATRQVQAYMEPHRRSVVDSASRVINGIAAPPLLAFQRVSFQYPDADEVLHDITFDVQRGDRIAVLGPNGAGKTTLVKLAIGLLRTARGALLVEGVDSSSRTVAQIARTIGFVFQSPSHMLFAPSVDQELRFGPENIGMAEQAIEPRINDALRAVNLEGYRAMAPLALSFGQQKRISIASILTMNPRILVLDEPTAGQDYANYTHLLDDIVARADTAARPSFLDFEAMLFITHDLDIAITYANRVLLLADGRLVADGLPEAVLSDTDLLLRHRIYPTSLLEANLSSHAPGNRFHTAVELALAT